MSLRKEGKARWVYECQLCQHKSTPRPDQLRAEEAKLRHEEGGQHIGNLLAEAVKPIGVVIEVMANTIASALTNMLDVLTPAFDQMSYALAPPPNVPNDPRMRADKRKWGGR